MYNNKMENKYTDTKAETTTFDVKETQQDTGDILYTSDSILHT